MFIFGSTTWETGSALDEVFKMTTPVVIDTERYEVKEKLEYKINRLKGEIQTTEKSVNLLQKYASEKIAELESLKEELAATEKEAKKK
jgi:chaperonin cofactor prefoldin